MFFTPLFRDPTNQFNPWTHNRIGDVRAVSRQHIVHTLNGRNCYVQGIRLRLLWQGGTEQQFGSWAIEGGLKRARQSNPRVASTPGHAIVAVSNISRSTRRGLC